MHHTRTLSTSVQPLGSIKRLITSSIFLFAIFSINDVKLTGGENEGTIGLCTKSEVYFLLFHSLNRKLYSPPC